MNSVKNSVLIVDDEELDLKVLNKLLSPEYTVYMTKSGSAALDLAVKCMPDIILLDIIMPDMNGFDVLNTLKSSEEVKNIPVIIITGLDNVEDEEKALSLKAADFIPKPFSDKVVLSRVRHQVQIVNQFRALEQYANIQTAIAKTKEKSKFFASMSHEMRTPLNAIIGLSELTLETGGLNEEARENIENISNAGTSLLCLVNDILDISKIEAGKFEIVPVEYNIPDMISDAVVQSIVRKGEKPIEFVLNIDETIPMHLFGDDLRIKQILNNLLSNAFKYTNNGTVELNIKCEAINNNAGSEVVMLIISIRDTGAGIKEEDLAHLFNEYTQADVKFNRTVEGTGLGLSITKMIIELLGGTIAVESEYGKGSIFTVEIPQKSVMGEIIGPKIAGNLKNLNYHTKKNKPRLPRIYLPYARVLVVDDVLTNLEVARGMMKPYRMKVDCVTSGQQAVDAVRKEKVKYNAIFMDHMMPEMNGIEATKIIREEIGTEYAKNVPIIAFTANAIAGSEEMFLGSGFQAYLSKPIDISHLDDLIRQWVRDEEQEKLRFNQQIIIDGKTVYDSRTGHDRRSGPADRRMKPERRLLSTVIYGLDINNGVKRFDDGWDTYLQVLLSFSSNTKEILETIAHVNSETLKNYIIAVHGLKSACRGICAEEAGDMAEALEYAAKAGDLNFVTANNPAFIETVSKLITEIDNTFAGKQEKKDKPKKDKPYKEALSKLAAACEYYNATEIDKTMEEIDAFEYTDDDGLAVWLQKNVNQMNYMEITERLSGLK